VAGLVPTLLGTDYLSALTLNEITTALLTLDYRVRFFGLSRTSDAIVDTR
jgi:hypothetical protein